MARAICIFLTSNKSLNLEAKVPMRYYKDFEGCAITLKCCTDPMKDTFCQMHASQTCVFFVCFFCFLFFKEYGLAPDSLLIGIRSQPVSNDAGWKAKTVRTRSGLQNLFRNRFKCVSLKRFSWTPFPVNSILDRTV